MNKLISIVVLVIGVSACQRPYPELTPVTLPTTVAPTTDVSATLPTPEFTPTIRPPTVTPSKEAPNTSPTPAPTKGWSVFQNDLLGYEFSYPPEAKVSSSGPDSYSPDDVPPGMNIDYFAVLESIYPDDLCVGLDYEVGFIVITAPPNRGGTFVTCGVTGVGDYDIVETTETVVIGDQSYSAQGYKVYDRDAAATFRNEFFFVTLEDGIRINYGGYWADNGSTFEDYVPVKEILLQVLASYQKTVPASSCPSNWSRLYPGIFAVVTGDPSDQPNRVRSGPSTSADVITQINPGQIVLALEGPTCSDGLVFWKVQSDAIPDGMGWTAEGDGDAYYLMPYKP
jgi:hypothetical protein